MRKVDRPWTNLELWALASSIAAAAAHGMPRKAACVRAARLVHRPDGAVHRMIYNRRYWHKGAWNRVRILRDLVAFERLALRQQGEPRDGTQGSTGA